MPLTRKQEVALAIRIKRGDQAARDELILANQPLVAYIAKRYINRGLELEDLIQEGLIGLMKAIEMFDHCRGYKFSTYAVVWIQQTIGRAIDNQARLIRLPVNILAAINAIVMAIKTLATELKRDPDLAEISKRTGFDPEKVISILKASRLPVSLGSPLLTGNDDDSPMPDVLKSEDELFNRAHSLDMVKQLDMLLGTLAYREEQVLRRRYGIGDDRDNTLDAVGRDFNVSRERIRQIEARALKKLRRSANGLREFLS